MLLKYRISAAFLTLLIFAGAFVSCSQQSGTEQSGTATDETTVSETEEKTAEITEDTAYKDNLPEDLDFGGETINIWSRDHYRFNDEVTVSELTGEIVNDAVYEREINTESRLNVVIENHKEGDHHGSVGTLKTLVQAGDSTYDLFTGSMYTVAPAAASGIFLNLYETKYLDLTKPYYTQDYIYKSQIGNSLFTITGDISLSLIRYSFCMYFNKNLIKSYNLESPYALVRDGLWTYDTMRSMVSDVYTDLNGNSVEDDEDFYGLGTSNVIIVDAYCSSFELNMIGRGEDNYPVYNIDMDRFASAVNKIYQLNWETPGVRVYKEISDNNEMTDLCNYFAQDDFIFINNWIYASETSYLRDMKSDYGIIPYPKYDENQKSYYTFQHDQIGVFGIPVTSKKADMASAVFEVMSSESAKLVVPAYYDIALKGKYSRDAETAEMIDIIHNNHLLDPAWIYCSYIGDLAQQPRNLMLANNSDFVSAYEKKKKPYDKMLERLVADFVALEQ